MNRTETLKIVKRNINYEVLVEENPNLKETLKPFLDNLESVDGDTQEQLMNILMCINHNMKEHGGISQKDFFKGIEVKEPKSIMPKKRNPAMLLKIDNYYDNVLNVFDTTPFFYDRAKIFWAWEWEMFRWEIVDETDILITIDEELNFGGQLVSRGVKANYLEAFKQVGRKNIPEEPDKNWIQFKKKIFNLKTKQISPASPSYLMCNPIPWDIGHSSETPVIDKLFGEWVGEKYVKTLYEMIAYCCITDYPIHLLFCLVGSGRNGKSQFQKIIQKFIGDENICATELDLLIDNRFETAKLYKKLVCTLGETNFGVMSKTSLLKKLTGGDLIGYEFKNKNPFDGYNYTKIIINSNSLPTSLDTSDGFYRRWFIIDFPNQFPEGKDIVETIPEGEYENLAKKVTEILPSLIEKGSFTNQGSIEERRKRYIMASNPISIFLDKCCQRDFNAFVKAGDFFNAYTSYLNTNRKRRISRKEFYDALGEEGLFSSKTNKKINDVFVGAYFVEGIELKENWKDLLSDNQQVESLESSTEKPITSKQDYDNCDNYDQNKTRFPVSKLSSKKVINVLNVIKSEIEPKITEEFIVDTTISVEDYLAKSGEVAIEKLKGELGIDDKHIAKLLRDGTIYEPKSGRVKLL